MSINQSKKYISGRDLKKQLEQRWSDTLALDVSHYEDKIDFTFVIFKLMVNFDVIVLEAKKSRPIIIDDMGDSNDHLFGIEEYLFDKEKVEQLEKKDRRLILKYMIDSGIINDAYKERDPEEEINRFKGRVANIATILNREGLSSREKIYLKQKKEDLASEVEKKISRLKPEDQKTKRPRTKVAEQIYLAAALRAREVLKDQIDAGLLPASATREKKLEILKRDKKFQRIISPLKSGDTQLIRRLHEAMPGLWQMGKTIKSSIYSS